MFHYAKNVVWGELEPDDSVRVTFDIQNSEGVTIAQELVVKGTLDAIQQIILAKVQTKSAAIEAYNALKLNSEFAVEMAG